MKSMKAVASLAACVSLLSLGSEISAQTLPTTGYWVNSNGTIWRDNYQECWRAGYWTPALAIPECEPGMAVKAVPAPAPAPAPVAAAPAPAPVVAPAPAPAPKPIETFRTQIVEKAIRLEGANFATGSSKLLDSANAKLDEVVKSAANFPDIQLTVSGYTDNVGNASSNQKLSQARAEAVKAYLTKKGVAASRVTTQGFGADNPIADNSTADGRAKNRRVEVRYTLKEETKVRVTQ